MEVRVSLDSRRSEAMIPPVQLWASGKNSVFCQQIEISGREVRFPRKDEHQFGPPPPQKKVARVSASDFHEDYKFITMGPTTYGKFKLWKQFLRLSENVFVWFISDVCSSSKEFGTSSVRRLTR